MANMAERVAISVPASPIGLTLDLRMCWEKLLTRELGNEPVNVYTQPQEELPDQPSDPNAWVRPEDVATLQHVGGLVVACYNMRYIPLDKGVLRHVGLAVEADKPVFLQAQLEEVTAAGQELGFDPRHITIIGNRLDMITTGLRGEQQ